MHTNLCACAHTQGPEESGQCPLTFSVYSFKSESLPEPRAQLFMRLPVNKPQPFSYPFSLYLLEPGLHAFVGTPGLMGTVMIVELALLTTVSYQAPQGCIIKVGQASKKQFYFSLQRRIRKV